MKKILTALTISAVCLAALTGCAQDKFTKQAQTNYISAEEAKTSALNAAKLSEDKVTFTETELDDRDGTPYYEVDFTSDGKEYKYEIDAVTGTVIEYHTDDDNDDNSKSVKKDNTSDSAGEIDKNKAKQIALDHAGVKESDTSFIWAEKDNDDGKQVYDVEFYVTSTNTEYDYEIDAKTGEIISFDYDAENYKNSSVNHSSNSSTTKTEQEIKKIALAKVPGATESDMRMELDRDDGKVTYEGEIVYQGTEYEFKIDAYSGAILEWEAESVSD